MDADVLFQTSAIGVYGEEIGAKIVSVRVRRFFAVCYDRYPCVIFIRESCGDGQSADTHTPRGVSKTKTKHTSTSALPSTYHVV